MKEKFKFFNFHFLFLAVVCVCLAAGAPIEKGVEFKSPSLAVSRGEESRSKAWADGFNQVYDELLENLKMPRYPFKTRYVQPGPAWPDDVFLWDTAFISEVWRLWDVGTARDINLAVLDHSDGGRLQHTVGANKITFDTQPPVMAWSVRQNHLFSPDHDYLARAYEVLKDYNRWLYDKRRMDSGLFFWINPFESGMDNSPRFASRNSRRKSDMKNIAAIDLSSYIFLQNLTLAKMAKELDRNDEAIEYERKAHELKELINSRLWDEETGMYYDRNMANDRLIRIKTISGLIPLFCQVPDNKQAGRLRDHAMDPSEFNTPFPLPSVARDEPAFEKDMWRGPVWINTSYMVILGLENYGFHVEAAQLAFRTVDWVYKNRAETGEFREFFDPDIIGIDELHRKTTFLKRGTMNDKPRPHFVGWTGLVNNLVVEHLIGLQRKGSGWELRPKFPEEAEGMELELSLPSASIEIKADVLAGGKVMCRIKHEDNMREVMLGNDKCHVIKDK